MEMPPARRVRPWGSRQGGGRTLGQAIVEFSIVSLAFFMMVFGTIDFGRAIYMYSQLHNAVREGARYGKLHPTQTGEIRNRVIAHASALNLSPGNITVSCSGSCQPGAGEVTVAATASFSAITQELLGIGPIRLRSSATVDIE
jgi:Flp pilus assembly protein TadG